MSAKIDKDTLAKVAWVLAHGSDRLKACLTEGWEWERLYLDERLKLEGDGWRYGTESSNKSPVNQTPPQFVIDHLREARNKFGEVCLGYWTPYDRDTSYRLCRACPWNVDSELWLDLRK